LITLRKNQGSVLSSSVEAIVVNKEQEYHNCEMTFRFSYDNDKSDFSVDEEQKYMIHTTVAEVEALNEALNVYQSEGFKENFLLYTAVVDGSDKYPGFVIDYMDAVQLGRALQALAKDEDSLVQLNEYCLETPPTYADDFRINKHIESITVNGITRDVEGYEDIEEYMSKLREAQPSLFA